MDTVLNLGLTDEVAEALAQKTGNPRFAYDSYRRFLDMFGDVVGRAVLQPAWLKYTLFLVPSRENGGMITGLE